MAVPGMKIGGQGRGAFLVLACALTGFVLPAAAQTGNRLSRLQQEAREYMRSIERQMDVLSEKLEGTQPDDAGRLQRARARIFQELVFDEMREISDLLETEEYLPALERIGQVRESLEEILAILQDRGPDPEELQRKLEELGRRRATVGQLADQQRELRDRTRDIEKAAADLETIRGVQEGIDELRAEQEALQGKTDGGDEDLQAAGREQLQGMQAEAEELARKLAEEAALQGTLGDIARRLEELAREARESVKQGAVRLEEGGGAEELSSDPEWSRLGEGSRERGRQAQALSQELAAAARQEGARAAGEAGEQRRQAMEEARRKLEEAAAAGREAAEESDSDPAGAQEARERESDALDEARSALSRAQGRQQQGASSSPSGELSRQAEELEERFGEWASKEENVADPESRRQAQGVEEDLQDAARSADPQGSPRRDPGAEGGRMSDAARSMEQAAEGMESLSKQNSGRSSPSQSQQDLSRKASELERQLDRLEKKLGRDRDRSSSPEEDERLQKKVGAARKALEEARRAMEEAAGRMQSGGDPSGSQSRAEEKLSEASQALAGAEEEGLERLRRRDEERDAIREEQERLKRLTRETSRDMEEEDQETSEALSRASGNMGEASEQLSQGNTSAAREEQEEALAELESEEQRLEEEEEELADLKAEQDLIDILAAVTEMKDEMEEVLADTRAIAAEIGDRRPSRKHRSKLKSASERVAGLHERGEEIAERLEEESARVFAYVMRDILEDVDEVRESLKPRYDPGELTQLLEQETISRLGKLKDALEEELRRRRQQQQQPQDQQPQQPGRPRMVPPVAELLMLKRMQVEILERTRSLNRARERDGELNPFQERILDRLALRQGSVLELTEKIASDFESAVGPGATGSGDGGQEGEEGSGEEGDGGEE